MAYTRTRWREGETPLSAQNFNNIEDGIEELQSQKVDKVSGKGLSSSDYTSAEKTKLAGIEAGAEVNPDPATSSADGLMSAADKSKLDGVADGATKTPRIRMQNSLGGLGPINDNVLEIMFSAPMTVVQGRSAVPGESTVRETIGIENASSSAAGLMSAADKSKLDSYPDYWPSAVNILKITVGVTIAANSTKSISQNVPTSAYTPIAMAGWRANSVNAVVGSCYLADQKVNAVIRNLSSSSITVNVDFYVLRIES